MTRLVLSIAAAAITIAAAAYYVHPQAFEAPLVQLNRTVAGLDEETVTVDSHEIHYLEGGSGEPVVLLHGIFGEKDHWVDFARHLTGEHRLVVPDLPGYGESSRLADHAYDYAAQIARLKALLDRLGLARVHLAGSSMGGTVAALFAMQHPERVASVAFIGAPHGIRTPRRSEMDRSIDAGQSPLVAGSEAEFERMLALVFEQRPFLPYPILRAAQRRAIDNAQSNGRLWRDQLKDRYLLDERIAGLQARTLALRGGADRVFDPSGGDVLRSRLKQARVEILPGLGHLPMMEAPKDAARLYVEFLASLRP